jgi:prepilin-type processing-associated H-X9-DG protein
LNVLWCPSDTAVTGVTFTETAGSHSKTFPQVFYFSSYAGCYGQWAGLITGVPISATGSGQAALQQQNGAIVSQGIAAWLLALLAPGVPSYVRSGVVTIGTVTDGTSNTIAFGEHAHGLLSKTDPEQSFFKWNWWISGNYGDTAFTSFYPINIQKKGQNWGDGISAGAYTEGGAFLNAATSFHPGGANFAFCDGSVRFLKDTISTWLLDATGTPLGATMNASTFVWSVSDPTQFRPGVYQALSTANGGEVVSADQF